MTLYLKRRFRYLERSGVSPAGIAQPRLSRRAAPLTSASTCPSPAAVAYHGYIRRRYIRILYLTVPQPGNIVDNDLCS